MLKILISFCVLFIMIACQVTTEPETSAERSSNSNDSSTETLSSAPPSSSSDKESSSDTEKNESSDESSVESSESSSETESSVTENSSSSSIESSESQESSSSQSLAESSEPYASSQDESSDTTQQPIELSADNIHLYINPESVSAIEVSALFDMPATEEMENNTIWSITADEDGTLNDEWSYLIYSFSAKAAPQKETGWQVSFDSYKTDIQQILKGMGLSNTEIKNCRNEWWDLLDGFSDKSYLVVYPQVSDSYVTLEIDPVPDVHNRILFYIEGTDDELTITEPDTLTINKEGYYTLEIGLMVQSQ